MSGASPAQSASPHPVRFSRHAGSHQRHADPRRTGPKHAGPKDAGQRQTGASQADQHADQPKGKTRKRRKRKRGRKVFARDENGAVQPAAPASTTASQPQSPPLQAERRPPPQSPPRPPQQELPVFAALDLGTNNCRLLVAVPGRHGQFRVIDAFSRIVRLGEGLTASGRLGQAAMDRAVEALKICGEKLRNRKIRKARLIATEACRSAANGVEFLDRVEREAGLKLEIIDRQTEARLAVSGCGSLVERDTQGVVLFDIGGGSSE
ncbi:MAG: Ppx/GppA family phosphatase, partial [Mesorhizobium sp.]